MGIGYVITGSVILIVTFFFIMSKLLGKGMSMPPQDLPASTATDGPTSVPGATDSKWWLQSDNDTQLQIAIVLIEKSLPVWERYAASKPVSYVDASSLLTRTIDNNLFAISLNEIKAAAFSIDGNRERIDDCYNSFVTPVLALQDGDWQPPYPVKKIFLSCFSILKGIVENSQFNEQGNFFAIAISHSLDCIEISKLYDGIQVDEILSTYKL